jgi:hypothetical protein
VLVNAFVGGMVGLERTIVPLVGSQEFGLVLKTAIFSFGIVKAFSNLLSGALAGRIGLSIAIGSVGLLTFLSGVIVAFAMREKCQP